MKAVGLRRKTTLCNRVSFILVPSVFQTDGQALGFLLFFFVFFLSRIGCLFFVVKKPGRVWCRFDQKKKQNQQNRLQKSSFRISKIFLFFFFVLNIYRATCLSVCQLARPSGYRVPFDRVCNFFWFQSFREWNTAGGLCFRRENK